MKSLFMLGFSLLISVATFAQTEDTTRKEKSAYQTILKKNKNGRTRLSAYFNVLNELSLPSKNTLGIAYSVGGEAVALYNQRFYLGGYSLVSVAPEDLENNYLDKTAMKMLQIGGTVGYKIAPNKPIHLNVGARIGYASLQWYDWNGVTPYSNDLRLTNRIDGWMVAPHVNVEVNFFSWMQAYLGAGYRFAWGGKSGNYDLQRDLRQPTIQLGISFGYFK